MLSDARAVEVMRVAGTRCREVGGGSVGGMLLRCSLCCCWGSSAGLALMLMKREGAFEKRSAKRARKASAGLYGGNDGGVELVQRG